NNAQSWAPLKALASGQNPQTAQLRGVLQALQQNRSQVKVPELVLGFKLKDAKGAEAQIARLEKIAGDLLAKAPPPVQGKVKVQREKVGGSSFLTVHGDGSIVPWDDVNLKDYEEKKDEFEDLIKHLKKTTLTISLGVKDGYLLLGISSSAKDLEQLGAGKGKGLAGREELRPLAKYAKERLTGLSYTSKEFLAAAS